HGKHPHVNVDDALFVETIGGDLTIKAENNTETGEGVYSEPVEERDQTLDDASIAWAKVGGLEPRVLTSFVRNRLIDRVYLPLIGDNLAKQIGTAGADART